MQYLKEGIVLKMIARKGCLFCMSESNRNLPIVFVHLNGKVPKYLKLNIERTIRLFPKNRVILLVNTKQPQLEVSGLTIYEFECNEDWYRLENSLDHPKNFRNNFWLISIARFIVLKDFLNSYKGKILHIESDVILSKDFPIGKFSKIQEKLAYSIVSKERGVASILYIRDLESASKLVEHVLEESNLNPNLTDMIALRTFYEKNSEAILVLPIGPIEKHYYHDYLEKNLLRKFSEGLKTFEGVFDGNDIGVYFFGTNPFNAKGKIKIRYEVPLNYANVSKWQIFYNPKRNFIDLQTEEDGIIIPVYSIHATSKINQIFSIRKQSRVLQYRSRESSSEKKIEFKIQIYTKLLIIKIIRKLKLLFRLMQ